MYAHHLLLEVNEALCELKEYEFVRCDNATRSFGGM